MSLHARNLIALLDLVRGIHEAPPWENAHAFLSSLQRVIPCDAAVAYMQIDAASQRIVPSPLTVSNSSLGDATALMRDHNEYFWQLKRPIVERILRDDLRTFHLGTSLAAHLPRAQRQEYRHDYWHRHGLRHSYAHYMKTRHGLMNITLSRTTGGRDFSLEERRLVDLLVPHLELAAAAASPDTAAFFVDARGCLLLADPRSEQLWDEDPGWRTQLNLSLRDWLRAVRAQPLQPLHVELRTASGHYHMALSPAGTGRDGYCRVSWTREDLTPALNGAMVAAFAQRYRLSPRETQILERVLAGASAKSMARTLGLAVDTVKEYLGTVYRKTGVDGHRALVARVLNTEPPASPILRSPPPGLQR